MTATFLDAVARLSSAEEFFEYLEVPYDDHVVRVNRLHILKRMHDYLRKEPTEALETEALREAYRTCLARAHADFVSSDAVTEKVFKVFRDQSGKAFVGLDEIEVLSVQS